MRHPSLILALFLLVACGSTSTVAQGAIGDTCTASSECASDLTCLIRAGHEDSVCTRECVPAAGCGFGFVCSATDVGSAAPRNLCARQCSAGSTECGDVWRCNTAKGACEIN